MSGASSGSPVSPALCPNDFLTSLKERVSAQNARLMLHTALVKIGRSGQEVDSEIVLSTDQARDLCMVLINQGGPAFQVGKSLYRQVPQ